MTWLYLSIVMKSVTRTVPKAADAPDVVAGEVDQHEVLRAFFGSARSSFGHCSSSSAVSSAPPGARDGANLDCADLASEHGLRANSRPARIFAQVANRTCKARD